MRPIRVVDVVEIVVQSRASSGLPAVKPVGRMLCWSYAWWNYHDAYGKEA